MTGSQGGTGPMNRGALDASASYVRAFWRGFWRFTRSSPPGAIALVILFGLVLTAIFAGQLAPFEPNDIDFYQLRKPPSAEHWAGTDFVGRDQLSRIIYGTRISLLVAFISIALGDTVGLVWGVTSGYLGGKFDLISQRFLDMLMAFPGVILALLVLAAAGPGLTTVIVAVAVSRAPTTTRVVRSVALSVKETQFVEAARAVGVSTPRLLLRHIAPQCMASLMVVASVGLGVAIFTEAALSFLGMGIPPPTATWGNMLGGVASDVFNPPWWMLVFPGVALTLTILAFNLLGDALRDYLDPRLRGSI